MGSRFDLQKQFEDLASELGSLRSRVRNLIGEAHWLTDGEWKEAVLRSVLRRHLPQNVEPLRGFVLCPRGRAFVRPTSQIDVLLYDNTKPAVFRDGDLVFVTPDAVRGIIEVKSTARSWVALEENLQKLSRNIRLIRAFGRRDAFAAYFAYESRLQRLDRLLDCLESCAGKQADRIVDYVALGGRIFSRFWREEESRERHLEWEVFRFPKDGRLSRPEPDGRSTRPSGGAVAPGYFVNNLIYSLSPRSVVENIDAWFPALPKHEYARYAERRPFTGWTPATPTGDEGAG